MSAPPPLDHRCTAGEAGLSQGLLPCLADSRQFLYKWESRGGVGGALLEGICAGVGVGWGERPGSLSAKGLWLSNFLFCIFSLSLKYRAALEEALLLHARCGNSEGTL